MGWARSGTGTVGASSMATDIGASSIDYSSNEHSIERLIECVPAGSDKNTPAPACRSNKCLSYPAGRATVGTVRDDRTHPA
jgi:hypothetical protein